MKRETTSKLRLVQYFESDAHLHNNVFCLRTKLVTILALGIPALANHFQPDSSELCTEGKVALRRRLTSDQRLASLFKKVARPWAV